MKSLYWTALAVAVLANIAANTALKSAMTSISGDSAGGLLVQMLRSGAFWAGLSAAAVLLASYLFAIRTIPVSIAYLTVTSLALVGLVAVDTALFGLRLGPVNVVGVGVVILGLVLVLHGVSLR